MKVEYLTDELASQLEAAWAASMPHRVDSMRSSEYLRWLVQESDSHWYQVGEFRAWLYVMDVQPGVSATIHALNLDGWEAVASPAVQETLKEIMDEFNLARLTAVVPAPVGPLHRALKAIGFQKEGRMRRSLIFNGQHTDAVIYGHLRPEVEHSDAPRRRRRRRRNKGASWEPKTQLDSPPSDSPEDSSDKSPKAPKASPNSPNGKDSSFSTTLDNLPISLPSEGLPSLV